MGSGIWFKNIISKKKVKRDGSQKLKVYSAPKNKNCYKDRHCSEKECSLLTNGRLCPSIEDAAAIRIQAAYRAHACRKKIRRIRGMVRLQNLVQRDSVKKQASSTMSHLHSWSRIQAEIRARRVHMVSEGRLRQKKMENQLKLEAKLHDLEAEWTGGSETIDEALAKIHQREEAAVKRERAMAYAFTHQWRANSNPGFGSGDVEISKANWGWSWIDRWIAARPWESRLLAVKGNPKKLQIRKPNKTAENKISPTSKTPDKVKLVSPNGKAARNTRRLSQEGAEKIAARKVKPNSEEKKTKEGS